ncbi:dimethyladenosine transferase [Cystoisospora suis]|uniref:rRNA adenine N(6)-methyltransferase n=1 Tax=Cystoisospora suis TaxID=483139 RepID=A0A2C6K4E2_9APIC|nr:dimethyladenosine transferase [Cystoisospora suis]
MFRIFCLFLRYLTVSSASLILAASPTLFTLLGLDNLSIPSVTFGSTVAPVFGVRTAATTAGAAASTSTTAWSLFSNERDFPRVTSFLLPTVKSCTGTPCYSLSPRVYGHCLISCLRPSTGASSHHFPGKIHPNTGEICNTYFPPAVLRHAPSSLNNRTSLSASVAPISKPSRYEVSRAARSITPQPYSTGVRRHRDVLQGKKHVSKNHFRKERPTLPLSISPSSSLLQPSQFSYTQHPLPFIIPSPPSPEWGGISQKEVTVSSKEEKGTFHTFEDRRREKDVRARRGARVATGSQAADFSLCGGEGERDDGEDSMPQIRDERANLFGKEELGPLGPGKERGEERQVIRVGQREAMRLKERKEKEAERDRCVRVEEEQHDGLTRGERRSYGTLQPDEHTSFYEEEDAGSVEARLRRLCVEQWRDEIIREENEEDQEEEERRRKDLCAKLERRVAVMERQLLAWKEREEDHQGKKSSSEESSTLGFSEYLQQIKERDESIIKEFQENDQEDVATNSSREEDSATSSTSLPSSRRLVSSSSRSVFTSPEVLNTEKQVPLSKAEAPSSSSKSEERVTGDGKERLEIDCLSSSSLLLPVKETPSSQRDKGKNHLLTLCVSREVTEDEGKMRPGGGRDNEAAVGEKFSTLQSVDEEMKTAEKSFDQRYRNDIERKKQTEKTYITEDRQDEQEEDPLELKVKVQSEAPRLSPAMEVMQQSDRLTSEEASSVDHRPLIPVPGLGGIEVFPLPEEEEKEKEQQQEEEEGERNKNGLSSPTPRWLKKLREERDAKRPPVIRPPSYAAIAAEKERELKMLKERKAWKLLLKQEKKKDKKEENFLESSGRSGEGEGERAVSGQQGEKNEEDKKGMVTEDDRHEGGEDALDMGLLQSDPRYRNRMLDVTENEEEHERSRPTSSTSAVPTANLPTGEFRPKQSLGQNFLSDPNISRLIAEELIDTSPGGVGVIEVGPGTGSITRFLYPKFPKMTEDCAHLCFFQGIEVDIRALSLLSRRMPALNLIHNDVLQVNWPALAREKNTRLSVVGNLPFYLTSQLLFCFLDSWQFIDQALVTIQWELAEVTAGLVHIRFRRDPLDSILQGANPRQFRDVLHAAFRQRRKMLRSSLKPLLSSSQYICFYTCVSSPLERESILPSPDALPAWAASLRPQHLTPEQFLQLTKEIFPAYPPSENSSKRSTSVHVDTTLGGKSSRWKEFKVEDFIQEEEEEKEVEEEKEEGSGDGDDGLLFRDSEKDDEEENREGRELEEASERTRGRKGHITPYPERGGEDHTQTLLVDEKKTHSFKKDKDSEHMHARYASVPSSVTKTRTPSPFSHQEEKITAVLSDPAYSRRKRDRSMQDDIEESGDGGTTKSDRLEKVGEYIHEYEASFRNFEEGEEEKGIKQDEEKEIRQNEEKKTKQLKQEHDSLDKKNHMVSLKDSIQPLQVNSPPLPTSPPERIWRKAHHGDY